LRAGTLALGCLLAASIVHPWLLAARQELVGRPIQEVEVHGLVTLLEESLLYYLELEPGRPWDPGALNDAIKELWKREFIDDIQVGVEPVEGGVKVIITLQERPILTSIDYRGLKKLNRADIADYIDRQRIRLYENSPLNVGELARLQSAIEELYAERGYRFADVSVELEKVSPSERRVLVNVDEGNKVKIGKVLFEGNEVFSPGKLRRQMKKTKKTNLITRLRKRDIYNPATVEEDLENIRELYRNEGYKNVQLAEPQIVVVEKNPDAENPNNRGRRLELVIPIDEGERWKLGDILIEGNEVLRDEILAAVFPEPKGGWLRKDVVDEGVEQITEFYNNTGYIFARVDTEVREREDLVADLVVKIDENDQFRVGRIEFSGNTRTQDRVLRRNLRVQEGMVFNSAALKNSLFRINQLEFFKLNEDEPVTLDYKEEDKEVDLVVEGREAERTEVQFGGGYSQVDGFFASAGIRTRNFLGRGETLGLSLQSGRYRNLFDVSYFVPWLFDRPQNVGIQIFRRDLDFDLLADQRFIRNERGGILTYGRSIGLFSSYTFHYSTGEFEDFRSTRFFFGPGPEDEQTFEQEFRFDRNSLSASYNFDSHDSRLEPTVGKRLRATLEYAGGVLGGDSYFWRPSIEMAYTRPLLKKGLRTVGRVNLEAGYIIPFGSTAEGTERDLFFNDFFFLGGENSIRGFAFRRIWVRDPGTGEIIPDEQGFPQGGDKFFQLNLEHHFLVSGPFRVVLFADAGNVYSEEQNIDLSHLRSSAGIELRITVPLFGAPLRFIYARNLDPLDDVTASQQEQFDSFDFSIGTSF
jgi:outer membrane protein insertion porin family